MSSNIYYVDQFWGRSRPDNGPKITVKVILPCCPFSNIGIGSDDDRLRYFLVHGRKVAFNCQKFKEYCRKAGWEMPEISKIGLPFDIGAWLADKAQEASVGSADCLNIATLANLIGLQLSYFQLAKPRIVVGEDPSLAEVFSYNLIGHLSRCKKVIKFRL